MPIFEYESSNPGDCLHCRDGFERLHKAGEAPLATCPVCHQAVRRIVSAPSLAKSSPSLNPRNIENHGFTQYRKSGEGTYEKTAGKGPRTITRD